MIILTKVFHTIMDIETLIKFGLSEKEAQIYTALLELGPSSVSEIAIKAKVNRTTAYDILEALVFHGLVTHVKEKKKHYSAENPELLISFLEKQSKDFAEKASAAKKILPELKSIYNAAPRKPKVMYFEGDDGLINMYEDSLTAKTEILSWLNTEKTMTFSPKYFNDYYKRRAKKGIHIKAIVNDVPTSQEIDKRNKEEDREMRIIPKEMMNIVPECYIYDNKVAFMSIEERFGVMVESKDIAVAQRKLYELAWKEASRIDQ